MPLYEAYAASMQALNTLPTLQQRVGNRSWGGAANPVIEQGADAIGTPLVPASEAGTAIDQHGIWGRIEGAHNRLEPSGSATGMRQSMNTTLMQAGLDGLLLDAADGRLLGGITGLYGKAHSKVSSLHGDGTIDTQGWGLGATLTWYGDNGFYLDTQAQAVWYDNDLYSATANKSLASGRRGFGYALSAETGQRIALDDNWSLTPQVQLMWSSVSSASFRDAWEARVGLHNTDSLTARIGLSADYRNAWHNADGQLTRMNIYGIANLYQEFMGSAPVDVADVSFATGKDRTWAGVGAGGTYTWADDKYAIYGEGAINTALNHFANSYQIKATAGVRVRW
ncbi:autotransporter outer membrane beta-barrel domain-containing protein [Brucella oryzae]|uniref:autotransporter family protein n=1 Tax=Brucella oryzae TaxID=335286 RepID=UPI0031FCE0E8